MQVLPDPVEDNNGVVDRETDDRQDSGDKYLVNLVGHPKQAGDREGGHHHQSIVEDGHYPAKAKLPAVEPDHYVDEDTHQRQNHRQDSGVLNVIRHGGPYFRLAHDGGVQLAVLLQTNFQGRFYGFIRLNRLIRRQIAGNDFQAVGGTEGFYLGTGAQKVI